MARSWRLGTGGSAGIALRQRLEQRPGLLQIRGVKPFSEPAIDRCQQRMGFGLLALLLLQPGQAHGGAQLQGFGLLAAGNGEGLMKTLLRFSLLPPLICLRQ